MESAEKSNVMRQVTIANEAFEEARAVQRNAYQALVDFSLRAVVDGEDLEEIIETLGIQAQEAQQGPFGMVLGDGMCKHQAFAQWLAQGLVNKLDRILEDQHGGCE